MLYMLPVVVVRSVCDSKAKLCYILRFCGWCQTIRECYVWSSSPGGGTLWWPCCVALLLMGLCSVALFATCKNLKSSYSLLRHCWLNYRKDIWPAESLATISSKVFVNLLRIWHSQEWSDSILESLFV